MKLFFLYFPGPKVGLQRITSASEWNEKEKEKEEENWHISQRHWSSGNTFILEIFSLCYLPGFD